MSPCDEGDLKSDFPVLSLVFLARDFADALGAIEIRSPWIFQVRSTVRYHFLIRTYRTYVVAHALINFTAIHLGANGAIRAVRCNLAKLTCLEIGSEIGTKKKKRERKGGEK